MIGTPQTLALGAGCAAAVGAALGWQAGRAVRGTTLVGPLAWAAAALLVVAAVEWGAALWPVGEGSPELWTGLRLIAATGTFCPLISLLGAKRPQDQAWHFVVLSLWAVLLLPAVGALVVGRSPVPQVPTALAWFMLLMVALGVANSAFTRLAPAGLLYAAGQLALLSHWLPGLSTAPPAARAWSGLAGASLIAAALAAGIVRLRTPRRSVEPFDRVWLDFRDRFGTLWALRVAERVNAASVAHDWRVVLRWSGFEMREGGTLSQELPPETARLLRQNLSNLLRRFVSRGWIADRLGEQLD